jgi:hypothetical protein
MNGEILPLHKAFILLFVRTSENANSVKLKKL